MLFVPALVALWRYLTLKFFRYRVTTERVGLTRGVLTKRTDSIELYRVKDTTLIEPFFLRMFGLSDVVLNSSDRTTPLLVLHAVPNGLRAARADSRQRRAAARAEIGARSRLRAGALGYLRWNTSARAAACRRSRSRRSCSKASRPTAV